MPRYFFDTADGDNDRDEEGFEFANNRAAREAAIQYLVALLKDNPAHLMGGLPLTVAVRDEKGQTLAEVFACERVMG